MRCSFRSVFKRRKLKQMFSLDYLVHAGALLFLMGFTVRDQLLLRGFIVIGTIFYFIYYLLLPEPLWSALSWNSLFIIINCVMMFLIYSDRAKFSMTKEEELYGSFYTLSPSECRKRGNNYYLWRSAR